MRMKETLAVLTIACNWLHVSIFAEKQFLEPYWPQGFRVLKALACSARLCIHVVCLHGSDLRDGFTVSASVHSLLTF